MYRKLLHYVIKSGKTRNNMKCPEAGRKEGGGRGGDWKKRREVGRRQGMGEKGGETDKKVEEEGKKEGSRKEGETRRKGRKK